jgi:hypothetical protein
MEFNNKEVAKIGRLKDKAGLCGIGLYWQMAITANDEARLVFTGNELREMAASHGVDKLALKSMMDVGLIEMTDDGRVLLTEVNETWNAERRGRATAIKQLKAERKQLALNDAVPLAIETRKIKFAARVREKWTEGEIEREKFIEYWLEHGENDRKLRFEKETSFGFNRRFKLWLENSNNWKTKKDERLAKGNIKQF